MTYRLAALILPVLLCVSAVSAADYRIEALDETAPSDAVSAEIAPELQSSGFRVIKGSSKPYCDIWLRKQWPVQAGFEPTLMVLYPFKAGDLLGVIRYHVDAEDTRAQEIRAGVYTLRYGQQPIDGNHVGTFDTRDFMLLIPAADDESPESLDQDGTIERSTETTGTAHPAILAMLRADADGKTPAMAHDEAREFWSARIAGKMATGDLVVQLVLVGHVEE